MVQTIKLELTLEELKTLDKYVELNDETRPLLNKIRDAYPEPHPLFDVIHNLGYSVDCSWEIVDAIEEFEKSKEPEEKVEPSMFSCIMKGNPPDGYVTWGEWYNELGSKGILHNLRISAIEYQEPEVKKLQEKDWEIKVETDYLTGKARHKTKIVDKDGNDYQPKPHTTEELLKPNWEPKSQTEEQVENGLKKAFREAVKQGVVSSVDKPKDDFDDLIEKFKKDPPPFLRFQLGKTLEQLIERWWCDVFTSKKYDWDMETAIDDLVDRVELWMPREGSTAGSQDTYACIAVDAENDLLKKIKSKLRNKKDT